MGQPLDRETLFGQVELEQLPPSFRGCPQNLRLRGWSSCAPGEILDTGVCHMAFFTDPDGNDLMLHPPLRAL
jgi:hypothetical protein